MPRLVQAPPPGIFRGATPDASAGRWFDCNNIRFRQGQLIPIGGNVAMPPTATPDLPRDLLTWHDNNYVRWAAFGTDTGLYVYRFDLQQGVGITPTGVGPLEPPGALVGYGLGDYSSGLYGTARDASDIGPEDIAGVMGDKWSLATFGEDLLVVPTQDGRLYSWQPSQWGAAGNAVLAQLVTNAPTQNRGVIVTDQRQAVLLGAGGNPRNIAWSDTENYTVWTPDVTNLAGSQILNTQAYVMTATKVAQGTLIHTSNDLFLMQYAGPPYAYGFVQIGAGCGPISMRAPVAIGSFVAWPSTQAFWAYNGYSAAPLPCDVQDWFFSFINRQMGGRVFGSPNPTFSELWWDWPDEGNTECNRYLALNYADQNRPWTIGMRSRTCGDPSGTMDYPILGGPDASNPGGGVLYLHEYGWTDDGTPRAANGTIYAESGSISLGEGDKRVHVKQLVFDAATTPPDVPCIGYSFFVREQPFDAASEFQAGPYTAVNNGLMDMRFSGRTVRMHMAATQDLPWAIGRPRLEVRAGGRR